MLKILLLKISFLLCGVTFGQGFEHLQKQFSDSLANNPSFSEVIAVKVVSISQADSNRALWYKQLGVSQYFQKKYTSAKLNYKKSIENYFRINDSLGVAKNYSNIGVCFNEEGFQDSAITYYTKAMMYIPSSNNSFRGLVYSNVGKLKMDMEMFESAKLNLTLAKQYYAQDDYYNLAVVYQNLGVCYAGCNNLDSAIIMNRIALHNFKTINLLDGVINTELNLANNYDKIGVQDSVNKYLVQVESKIKSTNNFHYKSKLYQAYGIYYYKIKDFENAKNNYLMSIEFAKNNNDFIMLTDLNQNMALTEYELCNYKEAYDYQNKYIKLNDSLYKTSMNEKILKIEETFKTKEKQNQINLLEKEKQITRAELDLQNQKNTQQKLWFILLVLVLIITSLIIILILNKRKIKAEKDKVEIKNKKIVIENKLLQTQMNPHFIFNSLNSIQRYVSENDTFNAQVYLARFGKLMRAILTQSRKETITLKQEFEALNLYVELEQLRFGHKFDFKLSCSVDNIEDIEIPPMIVQPFVENSILHGFQNLDRKAILKVDYKVFSNKIICTVTDNGVGQKKANSIKTLKNKEHKSLGIEVTKERLQSLVYGEEQCLSYEDIKKENQSVGTKVTITIYQTNEV